jgi:Hemerythrin HHE cation binding domain
VAKHADRQAPTHGHGWAYTRLIELHDGMRDDLALLQRVAATVVAGDRDDEAAGDRDDKAADDEARRETAATALRDLSIRRPGWTLSRYCVAFCGFVHEHHSVEDAVLFPMLLQHGGDEERLRSVIAKLADDHRILAGQLEQVERALVEPPRDRAARDAAIEAVDRLVEQLRDHLEFEETSLAPALDAVSQVVSEDDVPRPPPDPLDRPPEHTFQPDRRQGPERPRRGQP